MGPSIEAVGTYWDILLLIAAGTIAGLSLGSLQEVAGSV